MSVNSKMTAIADAIRLKTGRTDTLTLDEMASALNNIPTQTAKTIIPGTSNQTAINGGTFATGKVTVKGDSNLKAENIVSGKSIFGVNGTYVGADTDIEDGFVYNNISIYSNSRVGYIGDYAFFGNTSLISVNFPACGRIGWSAFADCTKLTNISFPKVYTVERYAFESCSALSSVYFPQCTTVSWHAFLSCKNLVSANFPKCTTVSSSAFRDCKALSDIHFPVCISIGYAAFASTRIVSVSFPACRSIASYAFAQCSSLQTIHLPACTTIQSDAFRQCTNLSSLYLAGSSICTLVHSNAFTYAGITSSKGAIYVPLSLGWSYKNATNWTYFFNRIFSIEGEEIVEPPISFTIDGIAYEATIDSTWSDWVISDYNTADFKINGAAIVSADGSVQIAGVIASDLIEENYNYVTSAIGAFGDPITFSVIVDTYTALDGMTWADWVSSEYNSSDDYGTWRAISVDMENNVVKYGDRDEIVVNEDWEAVTPYDLIIANMQYDTGIGHFPED